MEWILVPKNPTEEMIKAGGSWSGLPSATWQDMLDAAPIPPAISFVVEAVSQAVTDDPFEGSWDERLEHVLSKIRNELSTCKPPTKLTEDDKDDLRRVLGEALTAHGAEAEYQRGAEEEFRSHVQQLYRERGWS